MTAGLAFARATDRAILLQCGPVAQTDTCVRTCVSTGKGEEALAGVKGALTTLLRQV
jgi:hypothetical protein